MPSHQLVVRRGPKAGQKFQLKTQTVIIGRDSMADISLNDPEVSRNHCRLILEEGYYIQDLGSTNGTFIDGTRLGGEPIGLQNGQIIQLGSNVTLLYQQLSDDSDVMATMFALGEEEEDADSATALYDYESDPALNADEPDLAPQAQPLEEVDSPPYVEPAVDYSTPPPTDPTPDSHQETAAYEEAKKKQRRNYIIIGIVVAVLLLCCVCSLIIGLVAYLQNTGALQLPTAMLPQLESLVTLL